MEYNEFSVFKLDQTDDSKNEFIRDESKLKKVRANLIRLFSFLKQ